MLGLGLVVTTMVLLLSGTVFGVWSYYLDMKSLRDMTALLHQAEECKASVSDIKPLIEMQRGQKSEPSRLPLPSRKEHESADEGKLPPLLPEEKNSDPTQIRKKPPTTPEEAIEQACENLAECEANLLDGNHEPQPSTKELLDLIRKYLRRTWRSSASS